MKLNNLKLLSLLLLPCLWGGAKQYDVAGGQKVSSYVPSSFFNNLKVVTSKIMGMMLTDSSVAQC